MNFKYNINLVKEEKEKLKIVIKRDYKELYKFCKVIRNRLRNTAYDSVIGITGVSGTGKSNLCLILDLIIDDSFSIEKNVAFIPDSKEISETFLSLKPYSVFHIDEAIRGLHKLQFHSPLQQKIIHLYATERWRKICTLLCIPRFMDFTEQFRNFRIDVWIHLPSARAGIVFVRDDDRLNDDPWHLKKAGKVRTKFQAVKVIDRSQERMLKIERTSVNYMLDFHFPDLYQDYSNLWNYYQFLKAKSREKIEAAEADGDETSRRGIKQRNKLIIMLKEKFGVKDKEIGDLLGVRSESINAAYHSVKKKQAASKEGKSSSKQSPKQTPYISTKAADEDFPTSST